jgi:hypothetical protein
MNIIHKALIVIGALALLEAAWGLATPRGVKNMAGWFLKVSPSSNKGLGFVFALVAVGLCTILLAGQPLSAWVLLAVALMAVGTAYAFIKPGGMQRLLSGWILNRSVVFVRIIYGIELLVAAALIWIALAQL